MESLFSEEGVGVNFEGPVVRAGSLPLREGSGGEQGRVPGTCPKMLGPGLWVLGLPEPQLNKTGCIPVCMSVWPTVGMGCFSWNCGGMECGPPWGYCSLAVLAVHL